MSTPLDGALSDLISAQIKLQDPLFVEASNVALTNLGIDAVEKLRRGKEKVLSDWADFQSACTTALQAGAPVSDEVKEAMDDSYKTSLKAYDTMLKRISRN